VTLPSIDSELAAADVLTAVETTCAALFAAMPFPAAEAGEPETTNTRNGAAVIDKEHRLMNLTLEPAIPDRVSPVMLARYGTEATRSRMGGRPAVTRRRWRRRVTASASVSTSSAVSAHPIQGSVML